MLRRWLTLTTDNIARRARLAPPRWTRRVPEHRANAPPCSQTIHQESLPASPAYRHGGQAILALRRRLGRGRDGPQFGPEFPGAQQLRGMAAIGPRRGGPRPISPAACEA